MHLYSLLTCNFYDQCFVAIIIRLAREIYLSTWNISGRDAKSTQPTKKPGIIGKVAKIWWHVNSVYYTDQSKKVYTSVCTYINLLVKDLSITLYATLYMTSN